MNNSSALGVSSRFIRLLRYVLLPVVIVLVLTIMLYSQHIVFAGGGAGTGGTGTGGSGGHQSSDGYGWYKYKITSNGPGSGFRNGTKWSTIVKTCKDSSNYVYVFVIRGSGGKLKTAKGYNDSNGEKTAWTGSYITAGDFVSRSNAKDAFNKAEKILGDTGLTWHQQVGWFCAGDDVGWDAQPEIRMRVQNSNGTWPDWPAWGSSSATITAGKKVQWQHRFKVTGKGNPGSIQYCATDNDTSGTIKPLSDCTDPNKWSQNVGVGGSATANASTEYVTTIDDVGKKVCRQTRVSPKSSSSSSTLLSAELCATVTSPPVSNVLSCTGGSTFSGNGTLLVNESRTVTVGASGSSSPPNKITGSVSGPLFSQSINASSGSSTFIFTPPRAGNYTLNWTATDGTTSVSCAAPAFVGTQPYFEVSGGDILAGSILSTASVISWNGGTSDYAGANSNLAIIATGSIDGVITGKGISSNTPKSLSFANTGADIPMYGGKFSTDAIPDVRYSIPTSDTKLSTNAVPIGNLVDKRVYERKGDLTITGGILPAGKNVVIIAGGNIYISGNITYGYSSIVGDTGIPRLTIYAKNIIIGSAVTDIHGIFRATSDNSDDGGNFYSCGSGPTGGYDYAIPTHGSSIANNCERSLKVYGSVSADRLILTRTAGSWKGLPDTTPAEQFLHGPETWLNNAKPTNRFDSYVSLPPVL